MMKHVTLHHACLLLLLIIGVSLTRPADLAGQVPVEVPNSLLKIIRSVSVPAETEGVIVKLNVATGDVVSAGDMLAGIRQDAAKLAMRAAEFEYQVAKAKVENNIDIRYARKAHDVAQADLKRALDTNKRVRNTTTQGEIDHLRLVVERTKLEIEQAEQNDRIETLNLSLKENTVKQQNLFLKRHDIRAPIGGMIVAVQSTEGEWVKTSDPLVRIVRIDRLRVEDFVPVEVAIDGIKGNPVTFTPSIMKLQNQKFHGKIVFVSPEANSLDAKVRIWAEIENTDHQLRPGLKGSLTIHPKSETPADLSDLTTQANR